MVSASAVPMYLVADINFQALPESSNPEYRFLYADFAAVDLDTSKVTPRIEVFAKAPSRARRVVRVGDSLLPYLTGGTSWTQTRPLFVNDPKIAQIVFSTGFYSVSPRPGVDARFLNYLLSERGFLEHLDAISMGVTMRSFSKEQLAHCTVRIPELNTQRIITGYLDTATARIDALISKKARIVELSAERSALALSMALQRRNVPWPQNIQELEAIDSLGACRVMHLSQCLDHLTNGYVGPTRDILVDSGIRYVQSLHIKGGHIDFERRPFYVTEEWHAERPRIHLREDDVLIVQTGDIGQVAVVPPGFGPASCHALQIARVRRSLVTGPYLAEYLRSSLGYQSLISRATGALHPHLEGGIRDVPVIVPPLEVQHEVVMEAATERQRASEISRRLTRQIALLREYRQALITAVVTGELAVPGVAA